MRAGLGCLYAVCLLGWSFGGDEGSFFDAGGLFSFIVPSLGK
jgi:hypothetical protein